MSARLQSQIPQHDGADGDAIASEHPQRRATDAGPRGLHDLARLHVEAAETARLGSFLRRAPYAAWLLMAGVTVVAFGASEAMPIMPLILWTLFVSGSAIALLRLHWRTVALPMGLLPLRGFLANTQAVLLAAGFAWGSGAFLALADSTSLFALVFFSVGTAAAVSAILRQTVACLYFLAPAVLLPAAAALMRPLPDPVVAALLVSVLGLAVAAVLVLTARRAAQTSAPAALAKLS